MSTLQDCEPIASVEKVDASLEVSVSLNSTTLTKGDVKMPALTATWAPITSQYIAGIQFEYGPSDLSSGLLSSTANKGAQSWSSTNGVVADEEYTIRYRAVGVAEKTFGPWSAPANLTAGAEWVATSFVGKGDLAEKDTVATVDVDDNAINDGASVMTNASITLNGTTPTVIQTLVLPTDGSQLVADIGFYLDARVGGGSFDVTFRLKRTTALTGGGTTSATPFTITLHSPPISGADYIVNWQRPPIIPDQPPAGITTYTVEVLFSTTGFSNQTAEGRGITVRRFKDDR